MPMSKSYILPILVRGLSSQKNNKPGFLPPSEPVNQPECPGRTGGDGIGTALEKVPISESHLDPGPQRKLGIIVS